MNATDRWRILTNIVAQKGTRNVNLYGELAKAESMINMMDTQASLQPPPQQNVQPQPEMQEQPPVQEQQMGKYDNL